MHFCISFEGLKMQWWPHGESYNLCLLVYVVSQEYNHWVADLVYFSNAYNLYSCYCWFSFFFVTWQSMFLCNNHINGVILLTKNSYHVQKLLFYLRLLSLYKFQKVGIVQNWGLFFLLRLFFICSLIMKPIIHLLRHTLLL